MATSKPTFLETLFRRHAGEVQSFVQRRVGSQDAEDLLQDAYVRLLQHPDPASIANPRAYLYQVSANLAAVDRFRFFGPFSSEQYSVFADLTGDFQLLGMAHKVLLGADYYESDRESDDMFFDSAGLFPAPIDLFNPVYGQVDLAALQSQPTEGFQRERQSWYGLYFQDQITLWDRVHILGGGRYDWAETSSGFASTVVETEMQRQQDQIAEEAFSPRVGLVYQPWPWLSLYGNYVESFGANNGRSASGEPFAAQRGEQYEVGLKTEGWDGRLSSTLAFYNLTKTNLLTADLSTPDRIDSIAIGEARSRGIELDVSGRVTERLSLIASCHIIVVPGIQECRAFGEICRW